MVVLVVCTPLVGWSSLWALPVLPVDRLFLVALPFCGPNSLAVSIRSGVRLRHLARPEVPVRVRARRLREHEVVRDVGSHPLRGPDHQR